MQMLSPADDEQNFFVVMKKWERRRPEDSSGHCVPPQRAGETSGTVSSWHSRPGRNVRNATAQHVARLQTGNTRSWWMESSIKTQLLAKTSPELPTIPRNYPKHPPKKKRIAQYALSSWKLVLFLHSCSRTVGIPPMPSGLELDPNPGMDDHLFSLFCCLVAPPVTRCPSLPMAVMVAGVVAVGELCVVALLLMVVLADEPVVLGEL